MFTSCALTHVFGIDGSITGGIVFNNDKSFVYIAGRNLVVYDTQRRTQKFLPMSDNAQNITCIAVTQGSSRRFIAIGEKYGPLILPTVTIVDIVALKRKRVLQCPTGFAIKEFLTLSISNDNRHILGLGGEPDYYVMLWNCENGKLLSSQRAANREGSIPSDVQYSPHDSTLFSLCGDQIYKVFRLVEETTKPAQNLSLKQIHNIIAHCWVSDDRIVACCKEGDIVMGDLSDIRTTIASTNEPLSTITAFSRGFFVGTHNGRIIRFEKTDESFCFQLKEDFFVSQGSVKTICVNSSESSVGVLMNTNEVHTLFLNQGKLSRDPSMAFFSQTCHNGAITGMDVCVKKNILVTGSADKAVRIIDYENSTTILMKEFEEPIFSVAIHPSGFYLLVGFSERLVFFNILRDDLQKVSEYDLRSCREVRFNNSGSLFIACQGFNIYVYSAYSLEMFGSLKGHTQRIKSTYFSDDDRFLVSTGADGSVRRWCTSTLDYAENSLLSVLSSRSVQSYAVVCSEDGSDVFLSSSDRTLKHIKNSNLLSNYSSDDLITTLTLSKATTSIVGTQTEIDMTFSQTLFAGLSRGDVRLYKSPFSGECTQFAAHNGSVTVLRVGLMKDTSILFSAGSDGCVSLFSLKDVKTKQPPNRVDLNYHDLVLTTRTTLEESNDRIRKLNEETVRCKTNAENSKKQAILKYQKEKEELHEQLSLQLDSLKISFDQLSQEKRSSEEHLEQKIAETERLYANQKNDALLRYQRRLEIETEKVQEASKKGELFENALKEDAIEMKNAHMIELEKLKTELAKQYADAKAETARKIEEKEKLKLYFAKEKKLIEELTHEELQSNLESHEQKVQQVSEKLSAAKKDKDTHQRKAKEMSIAYETEKDRKAQRDAFLSKLNERINTLKKEIEVKRTEIVECETSFEEKEKRIFDLKRSNIELEKFKFILEYKIKELNKMIDPLNSEIKDLLEHIEAMNDEVQANENKLNELRLTLSSSTQHISSLLKQESQLRKRSQQYDSRFVTLLTTLRDCSKLSNAQELSRAITRIYSIYGRDESTAREVLEEDMDKVSSEKEHEKQRSFLEQRIKRLELKIKNDENRIHQESSRVMRENVELLKRINEAKQELQLQKAEEAKLTRNQNKGPIEGTETERLLELQREELRKLRKRIEELEAQLESARLIHNTVDPNS